MDIQQAVQTDKLQLASFALLYRALGTKEHEMKAVFFYGLFMDATLLKDKGLNPSEPLLCMFSSISLSK